MDIQQKIYIMFMLHTCYILIYVDIYIHIHTHTYIHIHTHNLAQRKIPCDSKIVPIIVNELSNLHSNLYETTVGISIPIDQLSFPIDHSCYCTVYLLVFHKRQPVFKILGLTLVVKKILMYLHTIGHVSILANTILSKKVY